MMNIRNLLNSSPFIRAGSLALLLWTLCADCVHASEKKVIEINGGFEEMEPGSAGLFNTWFRIGAIDKNFPVATEQHHGGAQSLVLPIADFTTRKPTGVLRNIDPQLIKPGARLELSGYLFLQEQIGSGEVIHLELIIDDPSWKEKAAARCTVQNEPGQWIFLSSETVVPPEFGEGWHVKIFANIWNSESPVKPKKVYFDDISLTMEVK